MIEMFKTKYPNNSRIVAGTVQVFRDDVVLNCDTATGPVTIDLLEIPSNYWNTTWKLYINDLSNNASVNNITINAGGSGQTINGATSVVLNVNGCGAVIRIASDGKFMSTASFMSILSGGHIIQDEGVSLPQQPILNFVGVGVTVTNAGGKTVVTIPGNGLISLTNAAMVSLMTAVTVIPGQFYLVTDANLTDGGALIQGVTTNTVSLHGAGLFLNPDYANVSTDNVGVWNSGLAGLVAGTSITIYNGLQYVSVTGAAGTAPDGDAVNWLVLAKSPANTYILEVDQIRYDTNLNRLLYRADKIGNEVEYVVYKTENSLSAFQWGNPNCFSNKALSGGFIGNINNRGRYDGNVVTQYSAIESKFNLGPIEKNLLSAKSLMVATNNLGAIGPVVTAFGEIPGNTLIGGTLMVTNQTATGTCTGNTITSGGIVSVLQNESELRNNFIHTQGTFVMAVNQARVNRNEIGGVAVAPVSPNTIAYQNKRAVSEYSNFDVNLDLNDAAIYNGGTFTLTIPPAYLNWVGVFRLGNSNKTINNIIGLPILWTCKFETTATGETTTFTSVAVAAALANEIVAGQAPGAIAVVGRLSGRDDIQIKKNGTFNAVQGNPNIYQ